MICEDDFFVGIYRTTSWLFIRNFTQCPGNCFVTMCFCLKTLCCVSLWRLVIPPSNSWSLSSSGFPGLKFQNKLCHCGRQAALWSLNLGTNRNKFYYCKDYKCGYYESYVPMENETSAGREIASHDDPVNLDNEKKANDELEKMLLTIGLHVCQRTTIIKMSHLLALIIAIVIAIVL